jgi:hypothetical protein
MYAANSPPGKSQGPKGEPRTGLPRMPLAGHYMGGPPT